MVMFVKSLSSTCTCFFKLSEMGLWLNIQNINFAQKQLKRRSYIFKHEYIPVVMNIVIKKCWTLALLNGNISLCHLPVHTKRF